VNAAQTHNAQSFFPRMGDVLLGVLAPHRLPPLEPFVMACPDEELYRQTLDDIQRFRGAVYVDEGALAATALDDQGRHRESIDERSWHLFLLGRSGLLGGCIRVTRYENRPLCRELKAHALIERMEPAAAAKYQAAVQAFVDQTYQAGLSLYEIGGWAVAPEFRHSRKALMLALACWALPGLTGPGWALTTSTARHRSADMMRWLGGSRLSHDGAELPAFFDPYYGCDMEILGFDRHPHGDYGKTAEDVEDFLLHALVVTPA
jgi:hypothetical protein